MEPPRPLPPASPAGWHVDHVPVTGSTNADLLAAAAAGAPDRSVLRTDHQTAGRGRLDRRWDAPPGTNLLVSFLFRDESNGDPVTLMRRVAIAAVEAVAEVAGVEARLKWPNDVLVDGRKLAGMLAQRGDGATVIGLGLNVGWAPEGAAQLGDGIAPADVLAAVLQAFDAFASAPPEKVHARYCELLATLGQHVRVELPGDNTLVGRVTGVEPGGQLVVLDECAITHRVDVGDVIHVRPAE
ncbi:MAG TPA: biotin--[acetyl-CoA-carboxylase] ligase [Ilumatobacter sp.]|nr:biotin--[acetyl-CoA-carboxylase] ligase [Ilumatobacter sp.]